jgi:hypothetical protein
LIALLVGAALALFSITIVVYPFLRRRFRFRTDRPKRDAQPTAPELEAIYDGIRTLQLEYQLGRVPEYLYQEQLLSYRVQAATVLRQETTEQTSDLEQVFEQEVLVARAVLRSVNGGPRPCPNCRSLPGPGLTLCPECGAQLKLK